MDFTVRLSLTLQSHNAILVVVDTLTKISHLILLKETYDIIDVA
jgi:hypothetical protein